MKKNSLLIDEKGFTLIELLAAITLLSIVIFSYLGFFADSIIFSNKVEDNLTAYNVAEEILTKVKDTYSGEDTISYNPVEVNGKLYYSEILIIDESKQMDSENQLALKRVHIKIYANDSYNSTTKPDSELYSYIDMEE